MHGSIRSGFRRTLGRWACALTVSIATLSLPASATEVAVELQQEAERLSKTLPGETGVGILDLRSGRTAFVNADRAFPMASTYKIAIAVRILGLVDAGKLDLKQNVVLQAGDIYPHMGGPVDTHLGPGSAPTLRDLLHMMLTVSDNNATDILLRMAGGGEAVTARLRELGIDGMRVDRPTHVAIANWLGRNEATVDMPLSTAQYAALVDADDPDPETMRRYNRAFDADPRDHATPRAMVALLSAIWQGRALKPETTAVLKSIMADCRTGENRLKGMLPRDTPVAHKTGTIGDAVNDAGVVTLPGGRGDVITVVLIQSAADTEAREATIAQVARAAHDYFLFVR